MQKLAFVIAALVLASPWSAAQTVYRCGNSYGTEPCTGGKALAMPRQPAAAEAARAAGATQTDWKRAEALEKARLAREKSAPKAIVIGPASPPLTQARSTPLRKPEQFKATAPGTAKPKKKMK